MQRTLVIIKPDAVNRGLIGELVARFEKKGLKISAMKMERLKALKLKEHYEHHKEKAFFNELIKYMSSIPSVLMIIEGKQCIDVVRKMIGSTYGREAESGTIRGDFSISNQQNLVHASEDMQNAEKEIKRFFGEKEIYNYQKMNFDWIYASDEKQ
jgi:nucleoside-diphosphate kinase